MRRTLCVLVFGLALKLANAQQQVNHGLSHQAGAGQQTPSPTTTSTSTPGPPHDAAFSSRAGTAPEAANPSETVAIDSALQTQIQDALNKDPILSHGHLKVTVLSDNIELSGEVTNRRERQNAARMAQSYARGKKVLNHIVVRKQGEQPDATSPDNLL